MDFYKMVEGVIQGKLAARAVWSGPEVLMMFKIDENGEAALSIRNSDNTVHPLTLHESDITAQDWNFKTQAIATEKPVELKAGVGHSPVPSRREQRQRG